MSFILDALRKSEQERQIASGRGVGMLYPVLAEHSPKSGLKPLLLAGAVLAAVAIVLIWWYWPKLPATGNFSPVEKSVVTVAVPPPPAQTEEFVSPARTSKPEIAEPVAPVPAKSRAEPVPKKSSVPAVREVRPEQPITAVTNKSEPGAEPPKGLPALTISGYINDEQGGRLAIINDKLVREGEEVVPGLRLEKIIDDSAVFIYKGHRFRR